MRDARIPKAWLRGGAGPMKDRRAPRGGDRAERRQAIEDQVELNPPAPAWTPASSRSFVCIGCRERTAEKDLGPAAWCRKCEVLR